jgi:hypothetical protein
MPSVSRFTFLWFAMVRLLLVLSLLLVLGACRSSTAPESVPSGELAALLSGAVDDGFSAVGAEPRPSDGLTTFASARPGAVAGVYGIMGVRARSGVHDALLLELYGVTGPGGYPARGSFLHGVQGSSFAGGRRFEMTAGEIQVTSVADGRIRGEFAAIAVEAIMRFPPAAPPETLQIRNGRFDVPIVPFPR